MASSSTYGTSRLAATRWARRDLPEPVLPTTDTRCMRCMFAQRPRSWRHRAQPPIVPKCAAGRGVVRGVSAGLRSAEEEDERDSLPSVEFVGVVGQEGSAGCAFGQFIEAEPGFDQGADVLLGRAVVPGDLLVEPQALAGAVVEVAVDGPVGSWAGSAVVMRADDGVDHGAQESAAVVQRAVNTS